MTVPVGAPDIPLEIFFGTAGLAHDSGPGHPESPARLSALLPLFEKRVRESRAMFLRAPSDTDLSLYRTIHSGDYIDFLEQLPPGGHPVRIDGDTQVSHATIMALREVSGTIRALSGDPGGRRRRVFCAVRPPGHHACFQRGMGFCAVNHVALLCALRNRLYPDEKILVLDFDVHHGNGTFDIVTRSLPPERVLFVSTHRFPFYPGTGSGKENLDLEGGGGILDIPLPSGTGDREYGTLLQDVILPRWDRFAPDTVLASAGFDAHGSDPLGDMDLSLETFEAIGRALGSREKGLSVCFLEGGYNLSVLPGSVDSFLSGWLDGGGLDQSGGRGRIGADN